MTLKYITAISIEIEISAISIRTSKCIVLKITSLLHLQWRFQKRYEIPVFNTYP